MVKMEDKSKGKISMSTPWGGTNQGATSINSCHVREGSTETLNDFVEQRTRVHEVYIREQEKTKRISLILAVVLIVVAAVLLLFAPTGKETVSYWICGALIVFASGAVGYKRVWWKSKVFSFGADQDQNDLK